MINYYVIYIVSILIICNLYITYRALESKFYEKNQKKYQILFIWLVPLVGLLIVWSVINQNEKIEKKHRNKDNTDSRMSEFFDSGTSDGGGGGGE